MKTRPEKLSCDSPNTIAIKLEHNGEHVFRVPNAVRSAQCIRLAGVEGARFLAMLTDEETAATPAALLGLVSVSGPEFLAACGALLGYGWRHETFALEAKPGRDVEVYGATVIEELEDAGYAWGDIVLCGSILYAEASRRVTLDQEALERADFFAQIKVGMT